METLEKIIEKKIISFKDLYEIVGDNKYADKIAKKYLEKGYLARVKKNLYVATNLETKEPIADKFMIASKITVDSTIALTSALEYHGYYNQVRNDCFVMTNTRFREFNFGGIDYKRIGNKFNEGITNLNPFIRITDLERSLVDVIKNLDKIISLEEIYNVASIIPSINEKKLKLYLDKYDIQFLYQKTGYILESYKEELNISDDFFCYLKTKIKTKRYLVKNESNVTYNQKWMLIVPKKGDDINYEIY